MSDPETITQAELAEAFEHEIDGCYVGGREFAVNVFAYVRERRAPDLITEWPPVAAALDRPTADIVAVEAATAALERRYPGTRPDRLDDLLEELRAVARSWRRQVAEAQKRAEEET